MLAHGTSVRKMGLPISQHSHSPLPSNDYPIVRRLDLSLTSLHQSDCIRGQRREGRRPLTSPPSHPSVSPLKTKDPLSVPLAHLGPTSPSLAHPTQSLRPGLPMGNRGRVWVPGLCLALP